MRGYGLGSPVEVLACVVEDRLWLKNYEWHLLEKIRKGVPNNFMVNYI
jgi:hypothetical protein